MLSKRYSTIVNSTVVLQWIQILPVMVHEHVDQILEELRLTGAEVASSDLINGLLQLWNAVVELACVVSVQ